MFNYFYVVRNLKTNGTCIEMVPLEQKYARSRTRRTPKRKETCAERTRLRLRRKEGRKGIMNQNRKETNMKSRRNDVPCYPPGQIARGRTCRPAVILVPRRAANLRFSKDWKAHMSKTDGTRETMVMKRQTLTFYFSIYRSVRSQLQF